MWSRFNAEIQMCTKSSPTSSEQKCLSRALPGASSRAALGHKEGEPNWAPPLQGVLWSIPYTDSWAHAFWILLATPGVCFDPHCGPEAIPNLTPPRKQLVIELLALLSHPYRACVKQYFGTCSRKKDGVLHQNVSNLAEILHKLSKGKTYEPIESHVLIPPPTICRHQALK